MVSPRQLLAFQELAGGYAWSRTDVRPPLRGYKAPSETKRLPFIGDLDVDSYYNI